MNALIVIAHPNPASFNYGLLERAERALKTNGHDVRVRDLCKQPFKATMDSEELGKAQVGEHPNDVLEEQKLLSWADHIVFIYPLWWFDRPAVLKGWCDRVLNHGYAFSYDESGVTGLLAGKTGTVMITAGGTPKDFQDMNVTERELLMPMIIGTLQFCGIPAKGKVLYNVGGVTDADRQKMLDDFEQMVAAV